MSDEWKSVKVNLPVDGIICPKCQKKSHYNFEAFGGLCPICWIGLSAKHKYNILGIRYSQCLGGCGWIAASGFDDNFGYCSECWLKLTPEERLIIQGKESTPKTVIARIPAALPAWKICIISIITTISFLSLLALIIYCFWLRLLHFNKG